MKLLVVIVSALLVAGPAFAAKSAVSNCEYAKVDTRHMSKANRMQNGLPNCYAYALANLMSFYAKDTISPYTIATNTQKDDNYQRLFVEGSNIVASLLAVKNTGFYCAERNINPAKLGWAGLNEALAKLIESTVTNDDRVCSAAYYKMTSVLNDAELDRENLTTKALIARTIEKYCDQKIPIPSGTLVNYATKDAIKVRTDIAATEEVLYLGAYNLDPLDEALSRKEPVYIAYDGNYLMLSSWGEDGAHASVLVGRKWNKKLDQCEYLIRNTWGTDCDDYVPRFRERCVNGDLWISRNDLRAQLYQYAVFYPGKDFTPAGEECYRRIMGKCVDKATWQKLEAEASEPPPPAPRMISEEELQKRHEEKIMAPATLKLSTELSTLPITGN
jgi:hypothetical protein